MRGYAPRDLCTRIVSLFLSRYGRYLNYTNTNTQSKKEFRAIESAEQSEKELSVVDGRGRRSAEERKKKDRRNN